jgi:hypothetical protein
LESNALAEDGFRALVFRSFDGQRPVRCGEMLAKACPYRFGDPGLKASLVPCSHCGRRHRHGSISQQLCEAWSLGKETLKEMRSRGERFFPHGTRELPYPDHTSALVRRLVWDRMKGAVLRRDRYCCQDCGEEFGKRRRKRFDPALRRDRGGYRWESLEVHHIIPRWDGGSDHPGNLKTLCPPCHILYTKEHSAVRAASRRERAVKLRELECERGKEDYFDDPRD